MARIIFSRTATLGTSLADLMKKEFIVDPQGRQVKTQDMRRFLQRTAAGKARLAAQK